MKKINIFIENNINKILSLFFILQPILDVIAAVSLNYFKFQVTLSSIIRFIFLFFCIYYLIFINKKVKNLIYLLFIFIYFLCFSLIIVFVKDFSVLFFELKNLFNVFYFPIVLLAISQMYAQYKISVNVKNIVYLYLIYILFLLIPNLTHTAFVSYSESKVGSVGWFLSANSVGNILSILFPLLIFYILSVGKKYFFKLFLICSSLYVFSSIGTKTPLLSFLICILITGIYYLIHWIRNGNYKGIVISFVIVSIFGIISILAIPKTSFYKNIQIHKDFLGINNYFDVFKDYKLVDHFIFSQRLTFLEKTSSYYSKCDIFQKFFGIGYIENYGTDIVNMKTIEIDYFDILYRNGIVGFILFFYVICSVLFSNFRKFNFNLCDSEIITSFILILLLAMFSGHVLVSPSVSIFVSIVLLIYFQGGFYEENYKR